MCKLTTTLKRLREEGACVSGYNKVVRAVQGKDFTEKDAERNVYIRFAHKDPITLLAILDSNGVDDCLWAIRAAVEPHRDYLSRMIAADIAESVLHIFTARRPNDARPRRAIEAARAFARGEIDDAARAAASAAAWAAARDAARDAASAAAWDAARAAARDAAWAAEHGKQSVILRAWLESQAAHGTR